jgi:probable rRNA maturation factor
MINIKNSQRSFRVNISALKKDAQKLLSFLGYQSFDLGVWLTTNKTIREYNKTYREKDKATDILSFAYHTDLKAGEPIVIKTADDKNLGDLIISIEYVQKDAPNWGQTFKERLRILLIHGICHLLGYDHELDADYEIMKTKEDRMLDYLKKSEKT